MKKLVVVANCQARAIAEIFRVALRGTFEIDTIVSHLATQADEETHAKTLASADCIFAQVTTDEYPIAHVRSRAIAATYAAQTVIWPNAFFNGQCPNLCYITAKGGLRLLGPLGPYHDRRIYQSWAKGVPVAECIQELQSTEDIDVRKQAEAAFKSLKQREQSADIAVSDLIEKHWTQRRLFFTFNHPTSFMLLEIARRLGAKVDKSLNFDIYPEILGEPLGTIIPLFSMVGAFDGDRVSAIGRFSRGVAVATAGGKVTTGAPRIYSLDQLVEASYRALDSQQFDRSSVRYTPVAADDAQDQQNDD